MIKVVYFDFFGVLTEVGKKGYIGQLLAKLYGVSPAELDIGEMHLKLRRGKSTAEGFFATLNKRYGKQVTEQQFVEKAAEFALSQDVYDMAARLRQHGIRTGILSNVFTMNVPRLRQQGAYDGFDPIILSCEVGYAKPDREIYELAIQQAGVASEEILFIDDQDKCLPPATALGMYVIQAINPEQIVADTTALIKQQNGIDL